MHRRTHRRLTEMIELLRQNILLARERGDPRAVNALEDTVQYVESLKRAHKQHDGFIPDPPSQAVRDLLALIRGPVEVRITTVRKRKKPAKTYSPFKDPWDSGNAGSPPSISPAPVLSAQRVGVRRKGETAGYEIPPEDLKRLYEAVRDLQTLVAGLDDDWEQ